MRRSRRVPRPLCPEPCALLDLRAVPGPGPRALHRAHALRLSAPFSGAPGARHRPSRRM